MRPEFVRARRRQRFQCTPFAAGDAAVASSSSSAAHASTAEERDWAQASAIWHQASLRAAAVVSSRAAASEAEASSS